MLSLSRALRIAPDARIAFTGAGGKTMAIFQLARACLDRFSQVFVTTTTHFSDTQAEYGDCHIHLRTAEDLSVLEENLPKGVIVITSGVISAGRVSGVTRELLHGLHELALCIDVPILIEADGSRQRPLKAPADHEPVIPSFADVVVVCAGLSALDQPFSKEWVHRPEFFAILTDLSEGQLIKLNDLQRVLAHPDGGLRGIPKHARRIALLNQADSEILQAKGSRLAKQLLGSYDSVLLASLREHQAVYSVYERVAGIVLAAGESRRMGVPKQLLDWGGKPLVARAAETALAAGCDPVIIVTGAVEDAIRTAVAYLPVNCVHNPAWAAGQSTSVKLGLSQLPEGIGAAVFMLVDQPFVNAELIRSLIEAHAQTLNPIAAPLIDQQRGNPVLFDRATFPDFEGLEGDIGGRPLFKKYTPIWVPWHDPQALLDIDTMADYQKLSRGTEDS